MLLKTCTCGVLCAILSDSVVDLGREEASVLFAVDFAHSGQARTSVLWDNIDQQKGTVVALVWIPLGRREGEAMLSSG